MDDGFICDQCGFVNLTHDRMHNVHIMSLDMIQFKHIYSSYWTCSVEIAMANKALNQLTWSADQEIAILQANPKHTQQFINNQIAAERLGNALIIYMLALIKRLVEKEITGSLPQLIAERSKLYSKFNTKLSEIGNSLIIAVFEQKYTNTLQHNYNAYANQLSEKINKMLNNNKKVRSLNVDASVVSVVVEKLLNIKMKQEPDISSIQLQYLMEHCYGGNGFDPFAGMKETTHRANGKCKFLKDNCIYEGHFQNGVPNGYISTFTRFDFFRGYYDHGHPIGLGVYVKCLKPSYYSKIEELKTADIQSIESKLYQYFPLKGVHWQYGMYDGNEIEGNGIIHFENGVTIEGYLSSRQVVGEGTLYFDLQKKEKYFGEIKSTSPHGFGKFESSEETYIGNYNEGYKNGEGISISAKLNRVYVGTWYYNIFQGKGLLIEPLNAIPENVLITLKTKEAYKLLETTAYGLLDIRNIRARYGDWTDGELKGKGFIKNDGFNCNFGCFDCSLLNGEGETFQENGEICTGKFKSNHLESGVRYILQIPYDIAQIIKQYTSCNHDIHNVILHHKATAYVGEFKDSTIANKGLISYVDGGTYEGELLNGVKHGKGKYYCEQYEYTGEWENDMFNGSGKVRTQSSICEGNFKNGKMHGKGIISVYYGVTFDGQWVNGVSDGIGVLKYLNGNTYEGQVYNLAPNGIGIMTYYDGTRVSGRWEDSIYKNE